MDILPHLSIGLPKTPAMSVEHNKLEPPMSVEHNQLEPPAHMFPSQLGILPTLLEDMLVEVKLPQQPIMFKEEETTLLEVMFQEDQELSLEPTLLKKL